MGKTNLLRQRHDKPDTLALRIRTALKISQEDLARLLNVSPETIRRYETGGVSPNKWVQPQLEHMASQNGVSLNFADKPKSTPKPPKHAFEIGARVRRRGGNKTDEGGEVIRLSPWLPRCRVRWDSGIERGYEESNLKPE